MLNHIPHGGELATRNRSLHSGDCVPCLELFSAEVDTRLEGLAIFQKDDVSLARDCLALFPRKDLILAGLMQQQARRKRLVRDVPTLLQNVVGLPVLVRRQSIKGMLRRLGLCAQAERESEKQRIRTTLQDAHRSPVSHIWKWKVKHVVNLSMARARLAAPRIVAISD